MYLWRRRAEQPWWRDNEQALRSTTNNQLVVIERVDRERIELQVASTSRVKLAEIAKQFGGRVEELSRDWLKCSLRQKTKPIQIGKRKLIVPAGAAFGTGEHATTAMCLTMLKRSVRTGDVVVDLGTGSGILALAAKTLGAKRVVAIDLDPTAIRVAKENARRNKIDKVTFRASDVRRLKFSLKIDVVCANLFSELLIEMLPKLKRARWLILSGFLRNQARQMSRALRRNKFDIVDVRRRGKWVAILARRT